MRSRMVRAFLDKILRPRHTAPELVVDEADVVVTAGYSLLVAYAFMDGEGFLDEILRPLHTSLGSAWMSADVAVTAGYSLLVTYTFTDGEGFLIRF
jgi:hypothetical protein